MSFVENSLTTSIGEDGIAQWFEDMGLEVTFAQNSNTKKSGWFGSNHDLGFCTTWQGGGSFYYSVDDVTNEVGVLCTNFLNKSGTTYWQKSADGKVLYIRPTIINSARSNIIAAEKEDGNWGIIVGTNLYTKDGVQTIVDPAIDVNPNGEFTVVKMRDPESGVNFTSLYRVLSAPCFTPAGMYVDFGGTPMRAATVQTASDTDAKICFAFPVA